MDNIEPHDVWVGPTQKVKLISSSILLSNPFYFYMTIILKDKVKLI